MRVRGGHTTRSNDASVCDDADVVNLLKDESSAYLLVSDYERFHCSVIASSFKFIEFLTGLFGACYANVEIYAFAMQRRMTSWVCIGLLFGVTKINYAMGCWVRNAQAAHFTCLPVVGA